MKNKLTLVLLLPLLISFISPGVVACGQVNFKKFKSDVIETESEIESELYEAIIEDDTNDDSIWSSAIGSLHQSSHDQVNFITHSSPSYTLRHKAAPRAPPFV